MTQGVEMTPGILRRLAGDLLHDDVGFRFNSGVQGEKGPICAPLVGGGEGEGGGEKFRRVRHTRGELFRTTPKFSRHVHSSKRLDP